MITAGSRWTGLLSLWVLLIAAQGADLSRPNVLLIVADDMGFSDAGCYGGEIATPNLDALAKNGLRFAQFYNTARCWPSRASILTGFYAQQVRRDAVPGVPSGSNGTRPSWAKLLPEMLNPIGYRSYHSGKWHVDGKPLENGFIHSYALNDHDRYFAPQHHTEDDKPLPPVAPESGYYATTAIADYAIKWLKDHAEHHAGKPFFEFLAFTSPHFPVQAPALDIDRYRDRYRDGWDQMREERWQRMRGMGLGGDRLSAIEREVGPPYANPEAMKKLGTNELNRPLPWSELNSTQRAYQTQKMAIHAAMVDRMDREIGRVLAQIRSMGALENTLVIFLSDNGASAEIMVRGDGHDPEAACGTGATFLSIGPGWASLANTPFRRHKTWVHEGGISTPCIMSWPQGIKARGELRQTPGHVIDLVPTILEIVGSKFPKQWNGEPVPLPPGKSLVPLLTRDAPISRDPIWWLHEGNRALRQDQWKIVAAGKESPWELFDLSIDRSETRNLASTNPEKVRELSEQWSRQTTEYNALARQSSPATNGPYTSSFFINTTPDGANLPPSAKVMAFPLLVRLHGDFFNFSQSKNQGEDIRFTTATGQPLRYQIEEWDPTNGSASIWVRIPTIHGNTRQQINMHWGTADAVSESNGNAVFNESNGYLSVLHLNGLLKDEVGSLVPKNVGSTPAVGVIGQARHLDGNQGIFGGDQVLNYPTGANPHSTEAWFRGAKPNGRVLAWGNEHSQGKVVMHYRSPPHVEMECYFSSANVSSGSAVPLGEWVHVVHTYQKGDSRIYINGDLDGVSTQISAPLSIKSPARLWIGGWYDHYDFTGDIDEVRVSKVARSADWIRLQFENQKPFQTLVGPLQSSGTLFAVSPAQATVLEGERMTFTATADGAQKYYWILKDDRGERVVAADRLKFTFDAGRVSKSRVLTLQLKAIYADEIKTKDIPITIQEDIPDPDFSLIAPTSWDGRSPIEIRPQITNLEKMKRKGAGDIKVTWSVGDIAVIKEEQLGRLLLKRAQNSGKLRVTATLENRGNPSTKSVVIQVTEPKHDEWITRRPTKNEKPVDNQFYARNDKNHGILHYTGVLSELVDSVFLKIYKNGHLLETQTSRMAEDRSYSFSANLEPGLMHYSIEFGSKRDGIETVRETATNVVCGDAYLIQGQSNAVATDWGEEKPSYHSEWIRTFGSMSGSSDGITLWGEAVHRGQDSEALQIGYWGMELARCLIERHHVPICIINGAVGGTRIDQHQKNASNPTDETSIYGRLLRRVQQAALTHGIRGILWHQGENDQGADGPNGGFGWENYRQAFIDLAAAWKQDYPNLQHYYVFQIWPKSCAMGIGGSDNRLREVQRTLPTAFSKMSLMSTLGIQPPGGCHFPAAGYAEFARLICPLVERDNYGLRPTNAITPPNLKRAYYKGSKHVQIVMEFDQPLQWNTALTNQFYLDGESGKIASGIVSGKMVTLNLIQPHAARTLTYLDSKAWNQDALLIGENGIHALTFFEVLILPKP